MSLRVVFDTNVILSALCFPSGRLAWLRGHWAARVVQVLGSRPAVDELIAALAYPKFDLSPSDVAALLGDFLPYVEVIDVPESRKGPRCRDAGDQKFVDLAIAGHADVLVTGDRDLLVLGGAVPFAIEAPTDYARRFGEALGVQEPRAAYRRAS